MKAFRLLVAVLVSMSMCAASHGQSGLDKQIQREVARLVEAAKKRDILWPWKEAEPEVEIVARYGITAGPLLVTLLDPDPDYSEGVDWQVQQQVALALCRIYGVTDEAGHVYSNRAPAKLNRQVRQFWLKKVAE